jgi:hypothetical protein
MSSPIGRIGGMVGSGRYASQGMLAPMNDFVDATGQLSPVSFRFLHSLFTGIQQLEQEVATLQQRLANAGIP